MPAMERLHQKLKDKDFAVIAVNMKEPVSHVAKFIHAHKLSFTTLLDASGDVARRYGVHAIPTTLIFDKLGNRIGTVIGPRKWDSRTYIRTFEKLSI
jgi:peroxiredoxin